MNPVLCSIVSSKDLLCHFCLFPAIRSGDYYLFDESEDEAEIEAGIDTIKFGMGEEEEKHGISPIEVCESIVW